MRRALLLLLFGSWCLVSCGPRPDAREVVLVFAASSLSESFAELAKAFESERPGVRLKLHFAGTPTLALQLAEGAPAQLFASADEANMERAIKAGSVVAEPRVFARNRLVIVTSRGNPRGIRGLSDLAKKDCALLLCGPEVPAGRYARSAFAKAHLRPAPRSEELNVKAVVAKVELGEADAGIVYASDALAAKDRVTAIPMPESFDVVARYPVAMTATGETSAAAREFLAFLLSSSGQEILLRHGFLAP